MYRLNDGGLQNADIDHNGLLSETDNVMRLNPWLPSWEEPTQVSWVSGFLDQVIDLSADTQGHSILNPLQFLL